MKAQLSIKSSNKILFLYHRLKKMAMTAAERARKYRKSRDQDPDRRREFLLRQRLGISMISLLVKES